MLSSLVLMFAAQTSPVLTTDLTTDSVTEQNQVTQQINQVEGTVIVDMPVNINNEALSINTNKLETFETRRRREKVRL